MTRATPDTMSGEPASPYKYGDLIAVLAIVFVVLLFHFPIVVQGKLLGDPSTMERYYPWRQLHSGFNENGYSNAQSDGVTYVYPAQSAIYAARRTGALPYWDRYTLSGQSTLTNPYSGLFYPFTYLASFTDYKSFFSYWFVFERLVFALLIYAGARTLNLSPPGAFISSIVTNLGSIVGSQFLPWDLSTVVWFGGVFFFVTKYLRSKNWQWLLGLPMCIGLSMLAGHLEYVLFLTAGTFLFTILYQLYDGSAKKRIYVSCACFVAASGLALSMAAVSIFPFLSLTGITQRSAFSGSFDANLSPLTLASFIAPSFLTRNYFYVGAAALALLIISLFNRRSPLQKAALAAFLILMVVGLGAPLLAPLLRRIPVISGMRGLERIAITYSLFLGLLIGTGFDALFSEHVALTPRAKKYLVLGMSCVTACAVFRGAIVLVAHVTPFALLTPLAPLAHWLSGHGHPNVTSQKLLTFLLPLGSGSSNSGLIGFVIVPALLGLVCIWAFTKQTYRGRVVALTLSCAIPIELMLAGMPVMRYMTRDSLFPETESIRHMKTLQSANVPPYRIVSTWDEDCGTVAPFRFLEYFGIEQAGGYGSVYNKSYREFLNASAHPADLDHLDQLYEASINIAQHGLSLLRYAAVKYVAAAPRCVLSDANLALLYTGDDMKVYEIRDALPRVYLAPYSVTVADTKAALRLMQRNGFDPRQTVILRGPNDSDTSAGTVRDGEAGSGTAGSDVAVVRYDGNRLRVRVSSNYANGTLVVLDNDIPGWRATVNGRQAEIRRAFHTFMAVGAPKGVSDIDFVYSPPGLHAGVTVTAVTVAGYLIVVLVIVLGQRATGRRKGESPTLAEPSPKAIIM